MRDNPRFVDQIGKQALTCQIISQPVALATPAELNRFSDTNQTTLD